MTAMAALRQVIERNGLFCALYSDRGGHFWQTTKAGGKVDKQQLTQVGRTLRELGIQMIPAYSPEARGRSERSFATWQGRLPQELRLHGISTVEEANRPMWPSSIAAFRCPPRSPAQLFCRSTDRTWTASSRSTTSASSTATTPSNSKTAPYRSSASDGAPHCSDAPSASINTSTETSP